MKDCSFNCGSKSDDKDPVDEKRPRIRWAYDPLDGPGSGEGTNCWYCERAWCQISHTVEGRDRDLHKAKMGRDAEVHGHMMGVRGQVVERAKRKHAGEGRRQSGYKRVSVKSQRFQESSLIRPDDDFWPWQRYKKKFGSPDMPRNRELGHRRAVVDGHKGVIIPGDNGEGPWRIRNTSGVKLLQDKEEEVSSDNESMADQKFEDLKRQHVQDYKQVAVGAMANILKDFQLTEEQADDEGRRQLVARKKRRQRAKTKVSDEAKTRRRSRGMFSLALSEDETDDDDETPRPAKRSTGSQQSRNSGGKQSATKSTGGAAGGVKLEHADDGPDGESRRSRGKPASDCRQHADQLWRDFAVADENTLFFSSKSDVQRRMLARWISKASQRAVAEGLEKQQFEMAKKKMQIMDQAIALHRKWVHRQDLGKACIEVSGCWNLLSDFASAAPELPVRCGFLWHLMLQIRVPLNR